MPVKQGIRILAIDDSSFGKGDMEALAVGVVGRGELVEGMLSFKVRVDGNEATEKIIEKIRRSHFSDQIKLVVLHGITLAGLNMVDIIKVSKELKIPVVSIIRRRPHSAELERAIEASGENAKKKLALLKRLNAVLEINKSGGFYVQRAGIGAKEFAKFQPSAVHLLRLAHLIANGIARGESKGRI
jgi:endonuclease V-like protein UPF0215 family